MKIVASISILLFLLAPVFSQVDSVLTYDKFIRIVASDHPVAKQAALLDPQGEAYVMKALGAFDPKIGGTYRQKYFDDKKYYQNVQGMLKIPTWFGVDLKAGYENGVGGYLNPEQSTPNSGLIVAGVSVPVGQGLFINERRADLKKAKIFVGANQMERQRILNDLALEAGMAYWNWFSAWHKIKVYQNGVQLAKRRLNFVRNEVLAKNRAAIDTIEASVQYQNRLVDLTSARNTYKNASAYLSVYLWKDGEVPLEIKENIHPAEIPEIEITEPAEEDQIQLDSIIQQHPEYMAYNYKVDMLEVDARLKKEQLKPTVNLNYNPLVRPINDDETNQPFLNNYKWGIEVGFPLFLRKERGDLKLAQIKLADTRYDRDLKLQMLRTKAIQSFNDWEASYDMYSTYQMTTENYRLLLEGERQLFSSGESTIFMVNSRENKYLNAQIKSIDYFTKNQLAYLKTKWSMATLNP